MALPDYTVSRAGQFNATGSVTAGFLKVFSGLVLNTFSKANVFAPLTRVFEIDQGHTIQIPVIGTAAASYHVAGAAIDGQAVKANERTIVADEMLICPIFLAEIDKLKIHYDVQAMYAREMGVALANNFDNKVARVSILAARAAQTISGVGNGGSVLTNAAFDSDGEAIADGLFDAAQAMDEKNVPREDRVFVCPAKQFYLLSRSTKVQNLDWNADGGQFGQGKVPFVAGFRIVMSTNMPNAVVGAVTGENNTYSGTFTNTVGVALQRGAVGTLKLKDITTSADWIPQNLGWLLNARLAVGHNILRPEAAVEFVKA